MRSILAIVQSEGTPNVIPNVVRNPLESVRNGKVDLKKLPI